MASPRSLAAGSLQRAALPVVIDHEQIIGVLVFVSEDPNQTEISLAPMLPRFEDILDPVALERIRRSAKKNENGIDVVTVGSLNENGLEARYNEQNLEIEIDVPAVSRKLSVISLTRETPPGQDVLPSSAVSGYLNANVSQNFLGGRQPLASGFDGAFNVHGFVLESSGTQVEGQNFERGDTRVVKDNEGGMIRFSAGDLLYDTTGFGRFQSMTGMSAVSNFNIDPYRVVTPVSRSEILLTRPSSVKVYINGRLFQTLQLPAGRHDLRDFPFTIGVNEIQLEVTDNTGRVEVIRLPYLYSNELLNPGIQQLSYAIGDPYSLNNGSRLYTGQGPTVSVSHKAGISDRVTGGGYVQANSLQYIAGLTSVLSTKFGTWSIEPGFGRVYGTDYSGGGINLTYTYTDYLGPHQTQRGFTLGLTAKSPYFALLGDLTPTNASIFDSTVGYGQTLFGTTSISLGLGYSPSRFPDQPGYGNAYTETASLYQTWGLGLTTSFMFTNSHPSSGMNEVSGTFFLNWTPQDSKQLVSMTGNTSDRSARTTWNYNGATNLVGGLNMQASAGTSDKLRDAEVQADYAANRIQVGATEEVDSPRDGNPQTYRTNLRAATTLAFAGGHFALSRPITDSFVLVAANDNLEGQKILVDPVGSDDVYEASTDWMGPAVAPQFTSYRYRSIHVSTVDLRPGLNMPKDNFMYRPTYKSGLALAPGTTAAILVRGVLIDEEGKPLALASGEVHSLSDPSRAAEIFFSDRAGVFSVENLTAGKYKAEFYDGEHNAFEFEVRGKAGLMDVGQIKVLKVKNP